MTLKTALLIFVIAALAGLCLLSAGVYLLAGIGWTMIAGGASLLLCAVFVLMGIRGAGHG